MAGDKRIVQLNKAAVTSKDGVFAIVDPITDITVQIAVQAALGATRASMEWQVETSYSIGDYVLFQGLTAWESLANTNLGNVPTEGPFWTAQAISAADGITDTQWAAGLFTYDDSKVIYNNAQYYLQNAAPFESSDIAAEITGGDWDGPALGILDEIIFSGTDPGYQNRQIFWDELRQCPAYRNTSTGVTRQIGREFGPRGKNNTASLIPDGTTIYVVSDPGTEISIAPGRADTLSTTDIFGWATEDIAPGEEGEITIIGALNDIDTLGFAEGTHLFQSAVTDGSFTNIPPEVPNYVVPIGYVVTAQSAPSVKDGIIYARIGQIIPPNEGQKSWSYSSYKGVAGDNNWIAGSYEDMAAFTPDGGGDDIGNPLEMHSSHAIVVLGATSTNMVVRVSGTSWVPNGGIKTEGDFEDIDTSGGVLDQYYETDKHWLGTITYTLQSGTGVICNGGLVKYWDNNDKRFVLTMIEWNGYCGDDDTVDLEYYEKTDAAFAYNAAGAIFTPRFSISDVDKLDTYRAVDQGRNFNFKIKGITDVISGDLSEGVLFKASSTQTDGVFYSNVSIQLLERRYE